MAACLSAANPIMHRDWFGVRKIRLPYLNEMYKKIPMDKKVVVVDCKGKQAPLAVRYLRHMGYNDICMLKGGRISCEQQP